MIADPMANLGDAGGDPSGGDTTGGGQGEIFNLQAQMYNIKKMDEIRSFMGIVSGCAAGIWGLTGLQGLVCFIMLDLFVSLSMMAKMNFSLKSYTRQSLFGYLTADMQKNSLSFMLFWTLFYGLVYLF
mmetsp:Transcript_661/g.1029  ORF Transcript_661/g.1029 Transcript_661/m.1029 type:complete len:128 (-) Transcript_661:1743-2126(-)